MKDAMTAGEKILARIKIAANSGVGNNTMAEQTSTCQVTFIPKQV